MRFQQFYDREQAIARLQTIVSGRLIDPIRLFLAIDEHPPYTFDDVAAAEALRTKQTGPFPYNNKIVGNGAKVYIATQKLLQVERVESQIDMFLQTGKFAGTLPLILHRGGSGGRRWVQDGHHRIAAGWALRTPVPIYSVEF